VPQINERKNKNTSGFEGGKAAWGSGGETKPGGPQTGKKGDGVMENEKR